MKLSRYAFALILIALVSSCTIASAPKTLSEPHPGCALEPVKDGPLANFEAEFAEKHGTQKSGFLLLDISGESLRQRLMLIDEARYSLDIKYF
jgi:hypothetical protein